MADTKWTPGPWTIEDRKTRIEVRGRRDGEPNRDQYFDRVATVNFWRDPKYGPVRDDAIANACLIAAAPDLYAALEQARRFIAANVTDGEEYSVLPQIDAALAKANPGADQ